MNPQRRGERLGIFATCANPGCGSGWLHLWRSRSAPVFEGGWSCSAACTAARVAAAVRPRDGGAGKRQESHRHRIPLGLVMLEQGWITSAQLRQALDAQKAAGGGRLGHWLVRQQGVSEQLVTRALGLQWSCPVLALEFHDAEALTALVPRLFVDAFGALPLRVAAGKLLYLGFEDRLDPVLALAVERMTGLRVESGLVQESLFRPAHTRMLNARFPAVELIEASSEPALVHALAKARGTGAAGRSPDWCGSTTACGCGCGCARRADRLPEPRVDPGPDLFDPARNEIGRRRSAAVKKLSWNREEPIGHDSGGAWA